MKTKLLLLVSMLGFWVLAPVCGYAAKGKPQTDLTLVEAKEPSPQLPAGASGGWWATVQEDIRKSEYNVTWQDKMKLADIKASYQAPNRAHNLRTYFTPEGIQVIPRTSKNPEWVWGLSLTGYGFKGDIQPVDQARLSVAENRVEYLRKGLTEWYVNDERGLEQGFTLEAPPKSGALPPSSCIIFKMNLYGDLNATLNPSASAVKFTTSEGARVVNFSQLHAVDAADRRLPAKFALADKTLEILVDTTGAAYPIIIDPLATSPNWTSFGEGAGQDGAQFGWSVGTAGDVNGDGYSDIVVGADEYDNGEDDEGRAWVYHGSASGLSTSADWTAESDQQDARLGHSVGTAGDVNGDGYSDVIVGADAYDNGEVNEGRVFVYHGSASGLPDADADGHAHPSDADWSAESDKTDTWFGNSVGTAGDVNGDGYSDVIIGTFYYSGDHTNEGRAWVYHGSASGLSTIADWTAEGDQYLATFGRSVGTAGDVNGDGYSEVVVGGESFTNDQDYEGKAWVYHGSASGLSTTADWTAEGDQAWGRFGESVGTAGDVNNDGFSDVIIGARLYYTSEFQAGKAWVYHGSASGLSTIADWTAEGDQDGGWFGYSVGTAGDVNGDGYADVIVGESMYSNGESGEGRALVYQGASSGLSVTAAWTAESDWASAWFGFSVGTAGDVNGDGYSDVIVGAPNVWHTGPDQGRAYVYHGSGPAPVPIADFSASPTTGVEPLQVMFTDLSTPVGEIETWAWDFDNDGATDSALQSPTHTYSSSGVYSVKLTVTSPGGTDSETKLDYVFTASCQPDVTSVSPTSGPNDQETGINVFGSCFEEGAEVSLLGDPYVKGVYDLPEYAFGVFVQGDYAYVADALGLRVLNVADPANPSMAGSCDMPGGGADEALAVHVSGDYAYVAQMQRGLQVIDVSNPANPFIIGTCDTQGTARGVYVSGDYAFVADGWSGLQIVDVSNPASAYLRGSCDTPNQAHVVCVSADYAYVADGYSGLQVIHVSNPDSPTIVGSCDTPHDSQGVHVSGGYAYVTDRSAGLQVIDVSNPANPSIVGTCATPGSAWGVHVSGDYAYVADYDYVQVIDVSNPANPSIVGTCDTPNSARDLHVAGDYAYVANWATGLQVISGFFPLPLTDVAWISEAEITATVPVGLEPETYDLKVTNPGGLEGMMANAFTVIDVPVPPVASFTANQTSGTAPLTVQFTDQSMGSITTWSWNFGDGGSTSQQNPSQTYTSAGDFTVSLTVTGPGGPDTETKTDYIHVTEPSGAPTIDKIRGVKEPGKIIRIIGSGFEEPQGDSEVYIGPKVYGPDHRKIKLWTDNMIKVRLPNYKCEWFKGNDYRRRKIWVMVGGQDGVSSNVKKIKVFKPDTCP